jgi:UPF0716 protein FxsA
MFLRLLLLFTTVPLIELSLLLWIGRWVGVAPTVALVLGTGFLGAWLARREGLRTLAQVQQEMAAGRLPAASLLDGLLILIAGAVLLTPGLLTDLAGFALLTPAVRRGVREAIKERIERSMTAGQGRVIVIDDRG